MSNIIQHAEFFLELEGEGYLSPKIEFGGKSYDVTDFKNFMPRLFQQATKNIDPKWLNMPPQILEGPALQAFLDSHEKNPKAPPLVWKNKPKTIRPDPLPILVLKDSTGAFADLWMDYGAFGRIDTSDHPLSEEEKFWERDLLQANFMKKSVGNAHYYCPLDKAVKTLTFLLEVGWTILDARGKKVVRQTSFELSAQFSENEIVLQGNINYGERLVDLPKTLETFRKGSRFVDLDQTSVGLFELPPGWIDLAKEEITPRGVSVRKNHLGLLEEIVKLPEEYTPAAWAETFPGPTFCGKLYDYQQKGVDWLSFLYRSHFHGLLADEMGLGKTVQLLAFLSQLDCSLPILVVMPHSLLFNWRIELERFLPNMPVYVHSGTDRFKELPSKGVVLTSYALLRQDSLLFEPIDFEMIILDEAQSIKNSGSMTAQIARRLKGRFRLAVTGTPVENRTEDLLSIFQFLMPDLELKSAITKKIRPFTLRRLKTDVDLELPPKVEQLVFVDLDESQRTFYDNFLLEKKTHLLKNQMEILEMVLRLRQICCHPLLVGSEAPSAKLERLIADLDEIIPAGHKVIIYSQFTQMLKLIGRELHARGWPHLYLDGTTQDRESVVTEFQNDPASQIFLISLKAGGVGLNLTAADYVFIYDPWWNEAAENQAIDRAHRVGRTRSVICRRYITAGTIEEKVLLLKDWKKTVSKQLLDFDEEITSLTMEDFREFF